MRWILQMLGIGGPEAQARELNADARRILASCEGQYGGSPTLARIAAVARERRDEVQALSLGKLEYYDQGLKHLTEVNGELRRANDQAAWSGTTLAIIYLRAELAGPAAAPARQCIDEFLARHPEDATAMTDTPGAVAPTAAAGSSGTSPTAAAPRTRRPWRE